MPPPEIRHSDGLFRMDQHRPDGYCPGCGKFKYSIAWDRLAWLLLTTPPTPRKNCGAVVSRCNICNYDSWIHVSWECVQNSVGIYPKDWRDLAETKPKRD